MTDRDPHAPRHGRPGEPPRHPYAQQPYGQDPYGQQPYGPAPGSGGQNPYGPPPPAYGGGRPAPPPGGNPYDRPYGAPPQGPPQPPRYQPAPGQPPQYHAPLYRREDGVAGPGFALPDAYRTPAAERPQPKPRRLFRLNRPARIIVSVVALVVGTGVTVGLPYRQQLRLYDEQKTATLSYKIVPKNQVGTIAGIRFVLGSFGKGDPGLQFQAPAGTTAVKALIGYRAPDQQTENRVSNDLEYVFRDGQGRTWLAQSVPGPSKGKVKSAEIKALVPTAVAGQVEPVVRPKQQLDPDDDPTRIPRGPALEFQH